MEGGCRATGGSRSLVQAEKGETRKSSRHEYGEGGRGAVCEKRTEFGL